MKLPLHWLALSCWLTMAHVQAQAPYAGLGSQSAKIAVANIEASVDAHLSRINLLNYQYPSQAQAQLEQIELSSKIVTLTQTELLRVALLKCYNLLELGEREAAITQARLGVYEAKKHRLDQVRPYFMLCEAEAHYQNIDLETALPLVDTAIVLAQQHQQIQALVNGLTLRADIDTQIDNYNSVMDDLRLALDMYPQAAAQAISWHLIPKIFITAAMSNLFYSIGDISQATFYLDKLIASEDTTGQIELNVYKNAAIISLNKKDGQLTDFYIAQVKTLMNVFNSPRNLAHNHGVLATIAFARGQLADAEREALISIKLLSKMDKPILLIRAQRTLAKIQFKQGRDEEALSTMNRIIATAKNLKQNYDLQEFYGILSQYYADKGDYKHAYDYQLLRYELGKEITTKMNQVRFLQFKAKLSEPTNQETQVQFKPKNSQTYLSLQQTYGLIALGLALLLMSLMYFIKKEPKLTPLTKTLHNQGNEIDNLLQHAKRGGYPLSLLLLNISGVRLVDLGELQTQLLHTLREQDKIYRHSLEEMIILLPHTSLSGARRVASQVDSSLQNWQSTSPMNIGVASLQQLESFPQLVKKAALDQLAKKSR